MDLDVNREIEELEEELEPGEHWVARKQKKAPPLDQSKIRVGPYKPGERHRAWPEWAWDGEMFRKSA